MMKNENDVERFADFKFITPGAMVDDDLTLELEEMCPYNPEKSMCRNTNLPWLTRTPNRQWARSGCGLVV